jgi:hypothetical protein
MIPKSHSCKRILIDTLIPAVLVMVLVAAMAPQGQMMIFNSTGNVILVRGKTEHKLLRGMEMLPGDQIRLHSGTVILVNRTEKRVSLSKPGNYSYTQVQKLMSKAEASSSIRYFVYVWESMQGTERKAQVAGGVVRGEPFQHLPFDSARVLSDTILFQWINPAGIRQHFTLTNAQGTILFADTLQDSMLLITQKKLQIIMPGTYHWQVTDGFSKPRKRSFIVPEGAVKSQLEQHLITCRNDFTNLQDQNLKAALLATFMQKEKIYTYPHPWDDNLP